MKKILVVLFVLLPAAWLFGQHEHATHPGDVKVDAQPLLAQALRLKDALSFLGSGLNKDDEVKLAELQHQTPSEQVTKAIQAILDPYCLAIVNINPESRVKLDRGSAPARLMQNGWTSFLVKVVNDAGATAQLNPESPNAARPLFAPSYDPRVKEENKLSKGQVANRFLELAIYRNRPLLPNLSGLKLEYAVLQIYSKEAGQREIELGFNIGQGTQDIGFRNAIGILFDIKPSVRVKFSIKDVDGSPTMASFIIRDGVERLLEDSVMKVAKADIRLVSSQREFAPFFNGAADYKVPKQLVGIYPLPGRRVAAYDEYPDFFFQPQVYRADGEHVQLPPGTYNVTYTRGPEYVPQETELVVPPTVQEMEVSFQLKRWVDMPARGWFSSDHHVHAAGCMHYESPEEGVKPGDMWRQSLGENVNVSVVLAWGPSWYYQKQFFTGRDNPLSTRTNILRQDVEVSGFPSSHAGHIVLLRLKEDDYLGKQTIEEWPSWTLPVLQWAQAQGGITGYAHSGWGLEPITPTRELPNYVVPKMDNIGANEFIVTVTHHAVDFYSAGDTPLPWELNMWYHTLNSGFTTRLSGETDFPCIYDERVGLGRSYFKPQGPLTYDNFIANIKSGRSYVTEGGSHLVDFFVNDTEMGLKDSRLILKKGGTVKVSAKVIANLPAVQTEAGKKIAQAKLTEQPFWHIERSRVGNSRNVAVELIVNGVPVDTVVVAADAQWKDIRFEYPITHSSWLALRILGSSHTNPIFVIVDGRPIAEKRSVEWCIQALDQCWKMKQANIRPTERSAAKDAYDRARRTYGDILKQAN
ncbi:MAG TPA: CehA/McbA family metallohydrolase [Chryseolinea sp.]|nr:CehA/McbA family metallohydrolase [Chryseolinea sp.]